MSDFSMVNAAAAAEKPNFSKNCNLLSHYGSFNDLTFATPQNNHEVLENSSAATTIMNLFPVVGNSGSDLPGNVETGSNSNPTMGLFPHQGNFSATSSGSKPVNKEPKTAQMTIFYGGQVLVFDDFPAEKAKEILLFAGQQNQGNPFVPKAGTSQPPSAEGSSILPTSSAIPHFSSGFIREHIQRPSKPVLCDLPIARKASLHRFLEKRKDRINLRAPYQISSPSKPAETEGTSWMSMERNLLNNLSSR